MLVDKESFVPGETVEKTKTATIKFTPENLRRYYGNSMDCPIFHALKDAGVPVYSVASDGWFQKDPHRFQEFGPDLLAASKTLARTSDFFDVCYRSRGIRFMWRKFRLANKEFTVTYA